MMESAAIGNATTGHKMTDDEIRALAQRRADGANWWATANAAHEQAATPDPAEQPQPISADQIAALQRVQGHQAIRSRLWRSR